MSKVVVGVGGWIIKGGHYFKYFFQRAITEVGD